MWKLGVEWDLGILQEFLIPGVLWGYLECIHFPEITNSRSSWNELVSWFRFRSTPSSHMIKAISFTHLKEEWEYLEIWRKEKFSSVWGTGWECPKSPKSTPLYPACPTSFTFYILYTFPSILTHWTTFWRTRAQASCWVRIVIRSGVCPSYCYY